MIADIREDAIPVAVDALSGHAGHAAGVRADVSVDADVDALADATIERFGRVDLVCNNAGVVCEQAPTWEQRLETWRWLIDVKLMGVVNGVRTFAPLFIAQGSGHFLNTASAGGLMPLPTLAPYNATMHAVVGLTETLNAELRSVSTRFGGHGACARDWWTPRWERIRVIGSDRERPRRPPTPASECRAARSAQRSSARPRSTPSSRTGRTPSWALVPMRWCESVWTRYWPTWSEVIAASRCRRR